MPGVIKRGAHRAPREVTVDADDEGGGTKSRPGRLWPSARPSKRRIREMQRAGHPDVSACRPIRADKAPLALTHKHFTPISACPQEKDATAAINDDHQSRMQPLKQRDALRLAAVDSESFMALTERLVMLCDRLGGDMTEWDLAPGVVAARGVREASAAKLAAAAQQAAQTPRSSKHSRWTGKAASHPNQQWMWTSGASAPSTASGSCSSRSGGPPASPNTDGTYRDAWGEPMKELPVWQPYQQGPLMHRKWTRDRSGFRAEDSWPSFPGAASHAMHADHAPFGTRGVSPVPGSGHHQHGRGTSEMGGAWGAWLGGESGAYDEAFEVDPTPRNVAASPRSPQPKSTDGGHMTPRSMRPPPSPRSGGQDLFCDSFCSEAAAPMPVRASSARGGMLLGPALTPRSAALDASAPPVSLMRCGGVMAAASPSSRAAIDADEAQWGSDAPGAAPTPRRVVRACETAGVVKSGRKPPVSSAAQGDRDAESLPPRAGELSPHGVTGVGKDARAQRPNLSPPAPPRFTPPSAMRAHPTSGEWDAPFVLERPDSRNGASPTRDGSGSGCGSPCSRDASNASLRSQTAAPVRRGLLGLQVAAAPAPTPALPLEATNTHILTNGKEKEENADGGDRSVHGHAAMRGVAQPPSMAPAPSSSNGASFQRDAEIIPPRRAVIELQQLQKGLSEHGPSETISPVALAPPPTRQSSSQPGAAGADGEDGLLRPTPQLLGVALANLPASLDESTSPNSLRLLLGQEDDADCSDDDFHDTRSIFTTHPRSAPGSEGNASDLDMDFAGPSPATRSRPVSPLPLENATLGAQRPTPLAPPRAGAHAAAPAMRMAPVDFRPISNRGVDLESSRVPNSSPSPAHSTVAAANAGRETASVSAAACCAAAELKSSRGGLTKLNVGADESDSTWRERLNEQELHQRGFAPSSEGKVHGERVFADAYGLLKDEEEPHAACFVCPHAATAAAAAAASFSAASSRLASCGGGDAHEEYDSDEELGFSVRDAASCVEQAAGSGRGLAAIFHETRDDVVGAGGPDQAGSSASKYGGCAGRGGAETFLKRPHLCAATPREAIDTRLPCLCSHPARILTACTPLSRVAGTSRAGLNRRAIVRAHSAKGASQRRIPLSEHRPRRRPQAAPAAPCRHARSQRPRRLLSGTTASCVQCCRPRRSATSRSSMLTMAPSTRTARRRHPRRRASHGRWERVSSRRLRAARCATRGVQPRSSNRAWWDACVRDRTASARVRARQ